MILKYWPLDEAATGADDRITSTNGAVDSEGMMCEFRVVLRGSERASEENNLGT